MPNWMVGIALTVSVAVSWWTYRRTLLLEERLRRIEVAVLATKTVVDAVARGQSFGGDIVAGAQVEAAREVERLDKETSLRDARELI